MGESEIETLAKLFGSDNRRGAERLDAHDLYAVAAPFNEFPLPASCFHARVVCRDISRSGIAFFWPRQVTAKYMLVGLGQPPHTVYVMARALGTTYVLEESAHLVRCAFMRKVDFVE